MNESLLVIGTWWKNKETGDIGFITDVQKKKGLIIFRFFQSGNVGSFDNMEFLRKFEISPSDPKSIPESNVNNEVTVGSIWRGVKGMEEYNKGRLIKVVHITGNLISWRYLANTEGCPKIELNRNGTNTTCMSSFLYCFEKVQDNDDGAIYRPFDRTHDSKENQDKYQMVKVIGTKTASTVCDFKYGKIGYITIPVASSIYSRNIEDFHLEFELVSLNPAEEFCVDVNDPNHSRKLIDPNEGENKMENSNILESKLKDETITPQQVTWEGAIWYHTIGGVHVAITIKEENDVVWYVTSDNNAPGIYWQMPREEWVKTYILYEGTVKPSCYPEGSFDKMIEETKERYERVVEMLKEGETLRNKTGFHHVSIENEPIMENSNETYLKTDESKMKEFDTGAKREDKSGKGRYDLIPGDIMADFVDYAWKTYFNEGPMTICDTDVSLSAYFDDMTNEELFFEFILNMTCLFFTKLEDLDETTDCVGERSYVVTWEAFHEALYEMREALAKHYEAGAKVHGVNNWKKGIPISDSERGGNFVDSMRRHTDQALKGLTDEPHPISAIWNAFAAIWTLKHMPENKEETKTTTPSSGEINLAKRIENYYDTKHNLENVIEILRKIINSENFSKRTKRIREVYFDIYTALVILNDIIVWFHEYPDDMNHITTIVLDAQCLINMNVGRIRECCGNIKLKWEPCPKCNYGYMVCCLGDPDEDKLNILYETIGRAVHGLLNRDENGLDPFCSLGITQSLAKFNTDCLKRRIDEK